MGLVLGPPRPMAPMRVAVIGGGIAGCGAAWSLAAAGHDVHIFESEPRLGGNAKTHEWAGSGGAISGLSVLAWPAAYFRNYQALLRTLGVPTELAKVRFFLGVEQPGGGGLRGVFAHGRPSELRERYSADLRRWERLVGFISRVNDVCSCRVCRRGQVAPPFLPSRAPVAQQDPHHQQLRQAAGHLLTLPANVVAGGGPVVLRRLARQPPQPHPALADGKALRHLPLLLARGLHRRPLLLLPHDGAGQPPRDDRAGPGGYFHAEGWRRARYLERCAHRPLVPLLRLARYTQSYDCTRTCNFV